MTLNLTCNEFPYFFPQIKDLSFFFISAFSILASVQLAIQMNFSWIAFNLSSLEGRESYILWYFVHALHMLSKARSMEFWSAITFTDFPSFLYQNATIQ